MINRTAVPIIISASLLALFGAPVSAAENAINAPPGFTVEHLYRVPKDKYGTWVGLTVDANNRLITSAQRKGIYRLTIPAVGQQGEVSVEEIPFEVQGAHGVTYAYDSLYVVANGNQKTGAPKDGLWRFIDKDGDGTFEQKKHLQHITGGGEHGFHSAIPGPDGESLYLVLGNMAKVTGKFAASRAPMVWGEDHLLPRMWDGRGHAKGVLAPGGLILKTDKNGKELEVISSGYRNQYDLAFDPNGEAFTFDADMEWDIGTGWYRPTRVNHVVSGSEFGWRSGAGKWPNYYADNLPPVVDIGLSSPTGVTFGTKAKFPAKYQHALFICDWTYGTLYAVHLKQDGASFVAEKEDFINGKPLPLTRVLVNPNDGAMYLITGGRNGQSDLYRVTYTGTESTAPAPYPAVTAEAKLRRELETLHLAGVGSQAIDQAWPHLDHTDRFVRWAARIAIERQPVASWQDRAVAEKRPRATAEAIVALARHGDQSALKPAVEALARVDLSQLSVPETQAVLRAYQLCFIRLGKPDSATAQQAIAHIDGFYPHADNGMNRELAQLLLYLGAPKAVDRTVATLLTATDEARELLEGNILARNAKYGAAAKKADASKPVAQQVSLAASLRTITDGWTPELRRQYFTWFQTSTTWNGGNSLPKFIQNIRNEGLEHITSDADERKELAKLSQPKLVKQRTIIPPKGPGQSWTVDQAVSAVQGQLKEGRNFLAGENLFHATNCAVCHRFAGQGGGIGPDLTGVGSRYTLRDFMMHTIDPSAEISDQYGNEIFTKSDGSQVVGKMGSEEDGQIEVLVNPFDGKEVVMLKSSEVVSRKPSKMSPMPPGLVNALNDEELADFTAYLMSGGNPNADFFKGGEGLELFDGKTLNGWSGNPKLWKVIDGVIVGETKAKPRLANNSFLIWNGGDVADFTLTFEARLEGKNNSGVVYRGTIEDPQEYSLSGYQIDMHTKPEYVAMLYSEGTGRTFLARRGEQVEIPGPDGKPKVVGQLDNPVKMDLSKWHTYEVQAIGNRLIHKIDGVVAVDVTDNHKDQLPSGVIGLQLHKGKPMKAFFKNIRLIRH